MNWEATTDRDPLDVLAAEFVDRQRRGERPSISEYARRNPMLEQEIRALFPIVAAMEGAKQWEARPLETASQRIERLGDFRIVRELGRGGMGIVYEAEQESLHRRVAVKVLPLPALLEPEYLLRFQREARLAASLHHPNIVPIYGIGEADGYHFYAMQLVDGVGLDQVLRLLPQCGSQTVHQGSDPTHPKQLAWQVTQAMLQAGNPAEQTALPTATTLNDSITPESEGTDPVDDYENATTQIRTLEAPVEVRRNRSLVQKQLGHQHFQQIVQIGVQVAKALAYAHSHGVLHRDIKPGNLLLDQQGTVWVTDFGLAKAIEGEQLSRTGDVIGTFRYMPPEQLEGRTDTRSDLYSLGLTLYELLTLTPAFSQTEHGPLFGKIQQNERLRVREINPAIPRDLETIILKCCAVSPEDRYQSAIELVEDLENYLEGRPIQARRKSFVKRAWKWVGQNRMHSCSLLFCTALLGTLFWVATSTTATTDFAVKEDAPSSELEERLGSPIPLHDGSKVERRLPPAAHFDGPTHGRPRQAHWSPPPHAPDAGPGGYAASAWRLPPPPKHLRHHRRGPHRGHHGKPMAPR